jgi:small subunit ribosomal protein S17
MAREGRKLRVGRVVSDKMDKTVVVAVRSQHSHPLYKKSLRRTTIFYTHDPENKCKVGDVVRIKEARPLSRTKRWRVLEILERREVAEVRPSELNEGILSEEEQEQEEAGT